MLKLKASSVVRICEQRDINLVFSHTTRQKLCLMESQGIVGKNRSSEMMPLGVNNLEAFTFYNPRRPVLAVFISCILGFRLYVVFNILNALYSASYHYYTLYHRAMSIEHEGSSLQLIRH